MRYLSILLIFMIGCCSNQLPIINYNDKVPVDNISNFFDDINNLKDFIKSNENTSDFFKKNIINIKFDDILLKLNSDFDCGCTFVKSEQKAVMNTDGKYDLAMQYMFENKDKNSKLVYTFIKKNNNWLLDNIEFF